MLCKEDGNLNRKMKTEQKSRVTIHNLFTLCVPTQLLLGVEKYPLLFLKKVNHNTDIQDGAFRITERSQITVKGNEFAV